MTKFKVAGLMLVLALVVAALPSMVLGDTWDKKTTITISAPMEIPGVGVQGGGGQVLPAGTYVIKLLASASERHIVQIFNESGDHLFATILAISNYRLQPTSKTVMTFRERAVGEPQALRAWFYPGDNFGQEFVYPKERALVLAKLTREPVLAMPTELAVKTTEPIASPDDPAVVTLEQAPVEAVKPTGEVVPVAEVVAPAPVQVAEARGLPETASLLPLAGLIGLLSLVAGMALALIAKRVV
jgi:hypothetical protein